MSEEQKEQFRPPLDFPKPKPLQPKPIDFSKYEEVEKNVRDHQEKEGQ